MAYHQLEELTSRKREKVALVFTAENMAGMLAVALPAYIATLGTTFWLRAVILVLAAVLGVLVTSDLGGMAAYERVLWWLRGRLRRVMAGPTLEPLELASASVEQHGRAVPLGRAIRRRKTVAAPPTVTVTPPFPSLRLASMPTPVAADRSDQHVSTEQPYPSHDRAHGTGDAACILSS